MDTYIIIAVIFYLINVIAVITLLWGIKNGLNQLQQVLHTRILPLLPEKGMPAIPTAGDFINQFGAYLETDDGQKRIQGFLKAAGANIFAGGMQGLAAMREQQQSTGNAPNTNKGGGGMGGLEQMMGMFSGGGSGGMDIFQMLPLIAQMNTGGINDDLPNNGKKGGGGGQGETAFT